jgi:hypothetical protein
MLVGKNRSLMKTFIKFLLAISVAAVFVFVGGHFAQLTTSNPPYTGDGEITSVKHVLRTSEPVLIYGCDIEFTDDSGVTRKTRTNNAFLGCDDYVTGETIHITSGVID